MLNNKYILIVDDSVAMQKMIKTILNDAGNFVFITANNGIEGLKVCENRMVDLIITDWNMPKMDGLELIKNIRANESTKNIPLLMVTAEAKIDQVQKAINIGVNGFIIKPFVTKTLINKVTEVLSGKVNRLKPNKTRTKETENNHDISQATNQKATVLVVDDSAMNIDVIVRMLKDIYKVVIANNGPKALKIAEKDPKPDLILLDVMMPEMDGIEVCRRLKANPMVSEIPVIFLTGKTDSKTAISGFALGAVDYIHKPIEAELLKARVKNQIDLKQARDEMKNQIENLMSSVSLKDDVESLTQHDLKNPLEVILNHSHSMIAAKSDTDEERQKLNEIERAGIVIADIVNNSLNLYKIESNTYQLNAVKVDLAILIHRIKNYIDATLLSESAYTGITLNTEKIPEKGLIILGEELLCFSILNNLIKNAVEASSKDDVVNITVNQQEKLSIQIYNHGVIPEAIQNNFFDKYVTCGKKGSIGLGAYSAKLMTEVQQGEISYESNNSTGTIITISFPMT